MKKINLSDDNYVKAFEIKKTSVRVGVKDFCIGRSFLHNVDTGEESACNITKVELMQVKDLDHRHAIADGFHSLGALMEELRKHYRQVNKDDSVTIVTFEKSEGEVNEIDCPKYVYHYTAKHCTGESSGVARLINKVDSMEELNRLKRLISGRFNDEVISISSLSFLHTIGGDE